MGFFSSGKDKAAEAAKAAAGWAALPFKKVGEKGAEAYYRKKGRWVKGVCVHCGNPIGNTKKEGFAHNKCHREASREVKKWQSSMEINNTNHDKYGRNTNGVRYFGCGCNAMNATHGKNCKNAGQRISDSLRKGLE
jgi:hypothetical protein